MLTLMLLNPQIYQAPESVIMNHRFHYFQGLGLCYFYRIKAMSLIKADHLQWTIYVKSLLSRFSNHQVNGNVYLSYLRFTHSLLQVTVTQVQQQLSRVNISVDFSIAFTSEDHKDFDHNENNSIYSKAIRVTGK